MKQKSLGFGFRELGPASQVYHLLSVWFGTSDFTSLNLGFSQYKIREYLPPSIIAE